MARVFDGTVNVSFHQCSLDTYTSTQHDAWSLEVFGLEEYYAGQLNGLCGAAMSGRLYFMTGLHSGNVGFTVDVLDAESLPDESWEDIVEVSFVQVDAEASLMHFYGPEAGTFALAPKTYRARYSAKNMDEACEVDTHTGDQPIDFYSLIFWPAPVAPDAILKQTGESAKYNHRTWGSSRA